MSAPVGSHSASGSAGHRDLAGLTLDAVLGTVTQKPKPPPQLYKSPSEITRTLLDVIRDEEPDYDRRDHKAWKSFKDRIKRRRAATNDNHCAWTPSAPVPSSDGPIRSFRYQSSRHNSARLQPHGSDGNGMEGDEGAGGRRVQFRDFPSNNSPSRPVMARRSSSRIGHDEADDPTGAGFLRPQFSRHNSTRQNSRGLSRNESSVAPKDELTMETEERMARLAMVDDRQMSAREAAAAQEAAEAAAKREDEDDEKNGSGDEDEDNGDGEEEGQPLKMSLMDLLDYNDDDENYDDEDEEHDAGEDEDYEMNCSVCMITHRGQPLVPCGHAYCKLCTKDMYVSRGYCPICSDFIQEILTVF